MDTQNPATVEIPNFKLAKVGKDRERKRGAAGWLSGGRGASGFGGAAGGAGAGGGAGLFGLGTAATKALLTLLVSAIVSAGAWQYGKMVAAKYDVNQKGSASKLFADKDGGKYADTSGVIKDDNSIPNSLGYVSGSTDGLTPEERAKKAAEAEAARKAAEEAQKKADAEAAKQPETPKSNVDANAVAESAVPKKGLTPGKFGAFGASLGSGSGLSGGAGLSGGINRNFGAASGLGAKGQNGALSAFRGSSKPSSAAAPKALVSKSSAKGFAKRQLDNAFAQSRQATAAGKGETAASSAAAPFDNNPGGGNVIAGPGVGNTTGGNSGMASSPNPTNTGGPTNDNSSNGAACSSADYAPDQNGVCQKIATSAPKNDAPWQSLIKMAEILLAIIAVLAIVKLIVEKIPPYGPVIGQYIGYALIALGAIVTGLGIAIMAMGGDKMQGGIITAIGAFVTGMALWNSGVLSSAAAVPNAAAGSSIQMAGDALEQSANSATMLA